MEKLLTAVFGEKCYFCGRNGRLICYGCEAKIKLCAYGVCIKCQQSTIMGMTHVQCKSEANELLPSQLCTVYEYEGLSAEIIKKSKYQPKRFALLKLLSYSGAKMASKFGFDFAGFTVVPIPISRARERDRGFNQAELIAYAVAKEFSLPVDNSILTRIRDTDKQFGLHRKERSQNISGAFAVQKDVSAGKFLLVDDICTTGATLKAASSLLLSAYSKEVMCFALSRRLSLS